MKLNLLIAALALLLLASCGVTQEAIDTIQASHDALSANMAALQAKLDSGDLSPQESFKLALDEQKLHTERLVEAFREAKSTFAGMSGQEWIAELAAILGIQAGGLLALNAHRNKTRARVIPTVTKT